MRADASERSWNEGGSAQRRLRIIHHASEAFFTHGYEHTRLNDVAAAAGVGKLAIYRHFNDKADLFRQVLIDVTDRIVQPLRLTLLAEGDVVDTLVAFACCYINRLLEPVAGPCRYFEMRRLMLPLAVSHPEIGFACRDIFRENIHKPLVGYFRRKIAERALIAEDPEFLAEHFIQMLFLADLAIIDPSRVPRRDEIEQHAHRTIRLFLNGCARG